MADWDNNALRAGSTTQDYAIDAGLRAYMLRVYNYMALGLALTGGVAFGVANSPGLFNLFFAAGAGGAVGPTMLGFIAMFAPLGLVLALSFGIQRMSPQTAQMLFWGYAGLMGLSLSLIFAVYTGSSIARTFFVTAAAFGALSLYGYTTKRDLSAIGTFLFMGLIGLFIAMIVNMFLHSSALEFAISAIGVLIFAGLTAYDTQRIKEMYSVGMDGAVATKTAVMGALRLYLDFLNMFLFLLRFMGQSRN